MASVKIDGQHVPLNREGLERAQREKREIGKTFVESVRASITDR